MKSFRKHETDNQQPVSNAAQFKSGLAYGSGLGLATVVTTVATCLIQRKLLKASSECDYYEEKR